MNPSNLDVPVSSVQLIGQLREIPIFFFIGNSYIIHVSIDVVCSSATIPGPHVQIRLY